jgi:hypothetical protein
MKKKTTKKKRAKTPGISKDAPKEIPLTEKEKAELRSELNTTEILIIKLRKDRAQVKLLTDKKHSILQKLNPKKP